MMPARIAALLLPLLSGPTGDPDPKLALELRSAEVVFYVSGPQSPFLGAVLLSLDPSVSYYFQGLPPLLSDHVVLALGPAQDKFAAKIAEHRLPAGITIYAQGVTAAEGVILSTKVQDFVLDGSVLPGDVD